MKRLRRNGVSSTLAYHILAIAIVCVWGTTFVSTKVLLVEGLKPSDIIIYRLLLAYVGICVVSRSSRLFALSLRDEVLFMLTGFLGGSLYFITENVALAYTNVSNVSLIVATTPLITMLIQYYIIKRQRPKYTLLIGSFITLVGVAAVIFNTNFVLKISPIGDMLCLLSALSWTLYTLLSKYLSRAYSVLLIARKTFFYGIVTLSPIFLHSPLTVSLEVLSRPIVWLQLLFLGGIGSFACFVLWNKCMTRLDTVTLSNYIYLVPVVSIITSTLILGEVLNAVIIVGTVMVLAGMYLAGRRS